MQSNWIRPAAVVMTMSIAAGGVWISQGACGLGPGAWASAARTLSPNPQATSPKSQASVQSVEVVQPQRGPMSRLLAVPGTIEAFERADLHARISGYISEVRADIGDNVRAGQVLAVLDMPEMRKELAEAQALAAAKKALLAEAAAKVGQARKMLELSRSQFQRYKTELKLREITFRRQEDLFRGQAISAQVFDETRTQLETAKAEAAVAQARIAAAEADVRGAEAAQAVAAAQVQVTEAQIERIRTLLEYAQVIAPFDGVIARRLVDRGVLAQPAGSSQTKPLFTIHRVDRMRIFVEVPEPDVPFMSDRTRVRVRPYGWNGEHLEGQVARTARSLNPATRTMRVEIDLPNPEVRLLDGMDARVTLEVEQKANALTIPAAALLSEGGRQFVYTVRQDRALAVPVEIGLDDGVRVEVKRGLEDHVMVIVAGKGLVIDGTFVRAVPLHARQTPNPQAAIPTRNPQSPIRYPQSTPSFLNPEP